MRVSVEPLDPVGLKGRDQFLIQHRRHAEVFLDGVKVTHCFTADDEEGFVLRARLNDEGRIYLLPGTDTVATEILRGKVEIR